MTSYDHEVHVETINRLEAMALEPTVVQIGEVTGLVREPAFGTAPSD